VDYRSTAPCASRSLSPHWVSAHARLHWAARGHDTLTRDTRHRVTSSPSSSLLLFISSSSSSSYECAARACDACQLTPFTACVVVFTTNISTNEDCWDLEPQHNTVAVSHTITLSHDDRNRNNTTYILINDWNVTQAMHVHCTFEQWTVTVRTATIMHFSFSFLGMSYIKASLLTSTMTKTTDVHVYSWSYLTSL